MSDRALLRLVPAIEEQAPDVLFCGHCGEPPPTPMAARSRVCALCGLGVLLSASATAAPKAAEPFVVFDSRLTLCALSRRAETFLGLDEPDAVDRHVSEFFEPADAEAGTGDELVQAIIAVAGGTVPSQTITVRPTGEFGVRYPARLARCGPSAAAVLVFPADLA